MKVLLTGATGFIGYNLINQLLDNGHSVKVLARNKNIKFDPRVEVVYTDLVKPVDLSKHLSNIEVILHLAAVTRALRYEEYYLGNVTATTNLLNAIDTKSFKQFIFLSSLAAIGSSKNINYPKNETDKEEPISDYGITKLEAEKIIQQSGINYTILRPCAVYGEGSHEFLPLFKVINNGFKIMFGNGQQNISLVYVKDLIDAILLTIGNEKSFNEVFHVGGKPENLEEINNIAAVACGRTCIKIKTPLFILDLIGIINNITSRIINRPMLLNSQKVKEIKSIHQIFSTKKIKDILNFESNTSLISGFKASHKWYIDNNWL